MGPILDGEPELSPAHAAERTCCFVDCTGISTPANGRSWLALALPGAGLKSRLDSKFELEVHKGELSRSRAIGRRPKQGVGDLTCATDQSGCVGCVWECGREGELTLLQSATDGHKVSVPAQRFLSAAAQRF
jgi:hypothetical protein